MRNRTLWILAACLLATAAGRPVAADDAGRPRIVAHRGLLRDTPENTLANFRACLNLRLGFEFDVRQSKDGYLVCVHDDTVDRTTNGTGRVDELTLSELKSLDAGDWFDPKFAGQRIPTLDEILILLSKQPRARVLVAVDLKAHGIEDAVVKAAEQHRVLDRLLFIGNAIGEPDVRRKLRASSAAAHIGCVANTAAELTAAIADEDSDWVYVRYVPSAAEVAQIHDAGKQVFIAGPTVAGHETDNWRRVTSAGVDGILTDYALPLAEQLRDTTTEP